MFCILGVSDRLCMSAGNVLGLAGSTDGGDYGACQPASLVQALLCQYLYLCAVWLRPGDYSMYTSIGGMLLTLQSLHLLPWCMLGKSADVCFP